MYPVRRVWHRLADAPGAATPIIQDLLTDGTRPHAPDDDHAVIDA